MAENVTLIVALGAVLILVLRILPVRAPGAHRYTSTACRHGVHRKCRKVCKYCNEPCRCPCHGTMLEPEEEPA